MIPDAPLARTRLADRASVAHDVPAIVVSAEAPGASSMRNHNATTPPPAPVTRSCKIRSLANVGETAFSLALRDRGCPDSQEEPE
jgi:hypothetical protein